LLQELYAHLNPMPYEAAAQMEEDLPEDLRREGCTVRGGHQPRVPLKSPGRWRHLPLPEDAQRDMVPAATAVAGTFGPADYRRPEPMKQRA